MIARRRNSSCDNGDPSRARTGPRVQSPTRPRGLSGSARASPGFLCPPDVCSGRSANRRAGTLACVGPPSEPPTARKLGLYAGSEFGADNQAALAACLLSNMHGRRCPAPPASPPASCRRRRLQAQPPSSAASAGKPAARLPSRLPSPPASGGRPRSDGNSAGWWPAIRGFDSSVLPIRSSAPHTPDLLIPPPIRMQSLSAARGCLAHYVRGPAALGRRCAARIGMRPCHRSWRPGGRLGAGKRRRLRGWRMLSAPKRTLGYQDPRCCQPGTQGAGARGRGEDSIGGARDRQSERGRAGQRCRSLWLFSAVAAGRPAQAPPAQRQQRHTPGRWR